jgi:Caspase domain
MRALLLLLMSLPAGAIERYAVVIGNNRPEGAREVTLRYADDDAAATHRLLREAGVHSVLLTTFDADTARLTEPLRPDGPATWTALSRTLETTFAAMPREAELFLFYSGHGDVAHGEGYVVLEDARLTRRMLHQLLVRSPARRNHVVIDACKSYFLAFGRGPGGSRSEYAHAFADAQLPSALANTGFVLSTSSDHDSHEWERFSAGVFSYEVRSALRGAADLDGNGHISYAELGAFLSTANEAIANPRFRPDFAVRPPAGALDGEILAWPGQPATTVGGELGHVYVETAAGERLLDGHAAAGQTLALYLPPARPLFVRRGDDSMEYTLSQPGPTSLAELTPAPPISARKGALHLAFEQLFAEAFGPAKLMAFAARHAEAERLLDRARSDERSRRTTRLALGWSAAALLTAGVILSAVTIERYHTGLGASQRERVTLNETLSGLEPAVGVTLGAAAVVGGAWLGVTLRWR